MPKVEKEKYLAEARARLKARWDEELAKIEYDYTSGLTRLYRGLEADGKIEPGRLLDEETITEAINSHALVYLYGGHRIGKSITLQHFLMEYMRAWRLPVHYTSAIDLVYKITALESEEKRRLIKHLTEHHFLLVIDEMDKVHLTDAREMIFFYLLDQRKNNSKLTILCANSSIDDLEKKLGKIICSRIKHEASIINWQ